MTRPACARRQDDEGSVMRSPREAQARDQLGTIHAAGQQHIRHDDISLPRGSQGMPGVRHTNHHKSVAAQAVQVQGTRAHWASAVAVWLGSWLSGYFIVATNAWTQHPVGYEIGPNCAAQLTSFWA